MSKVKVLAGALFITGLLAAVPAAASAHVPAAHAAHVVPQTSVSLSCNQADFSYMSFPATKSMITVTFKDVTTNTVLKTQPVYTTGPSGSISISPPDTSARQGDTFSFSGTWTVDGGGSFSTSEQMYCASATGPQGPAGPAGPQGAPGPQGVAGPPGTISAGPPAKHVKSPKHVCERVSGAKLSMTNYGARAGLTTMTVSAKHATRIVIRVFGYKDSHMASRTIHGAHGTWTVSLADGGVWGLNPAYRNTTWGTHEVTAEFLGKCGQETRSELFLNNDPL